MAKGAYIGNSNSRKVKRIYLGDGTSHKVKKGYIGVDGLAKLFFSGATVWGKYNTVTTNTYYWNRYNRVSTYRYYWDRYNLNSTVYFKWKRYNIITQNIYKWNKYNQTFSEEYADRLALQSSASSTFTNNSGTSIKYWRTNVTRGTYEVSISADGKISGVTYGNRQLSALTMSPGDSLDANEDYITILEIGTSFRISRSGRQFSITNVGSNVGTCYLRLFGTDHFTSEGDPGTGYYYYKIVGEKGTYFGEYTSSIRNDKPDNGSDPDGYWYEYQGSTQEQIKGSYLDDVESTNSSAYPDNGISGNYWYVYDSTRVEYSQGSANGSVNSTNRSAYPDNGRSGSYWYVYDRQTTSYSQGSYINQVSSTNRGAYPDNNYSGSYWYVYDHVNTTYSRGSYIGTVESDSPSAYPDNGRHTDGYWYVLQSE